MSAINAFVWVVYWIETHKPLLYGIAAFVLLLIIRAFVKHRSRKEYLALPVMLVGNAATMEYHRPECSAVREILPENRIAFRRSSDLNSRLYHPCKLCRPEPEVLYGIKKQTLL